MAATASRSNSPFRGFSAMPASSAFSRAPPKSRRTSLHAAYWTAATDPTRWRAGAKRPWRLDRHRLMCETSRMFALFILIIVVLVYLLGSVRVLRRYERRDVFCLREF